MDFHNGGSDCFTYLKFWSYYKNLNVTLSNIKFENFKRSSIYGGPCAVYLVYIVLQKYIF
jgi:hypothetical protein